MDFGVSGMVLLNIRTRKDPKPASGSQDSWEAWKVILWTPFAYSPSFNTPVQTKGMKSHPNT
jgi:hypothetical protein